MGMEGTVDCGLVAAESVCEKARNAPYGSDTDPGQVMNLTVGQPLLQVFNNLPAVYERLEFRGCTQVFEETPTFVDSLETAESCAQGIFGTRLLSLCFVSIGLHVVY